jgi:3-oxoacyl-[acyl-carrier protein] reductase
VDLGIAGKTAAVAAASTGLGFGVAAALAAEGVRVAICSRDSARIKDAAERLGEPAVGLVADVSSPEGASGFVSQAREALGPIDILIPNAGGPPPGTFATTSQKAYQEALDLNLHSTIAMCREAVPEMQKRGWGRVVAITSMGAREPISFLAASSTARAAVTAFLKVMAGEVAGDGVTVTSIQPGAHATERMAGRDLSEVGKGIPVGFVGTAEDFGQAVAFLCSQQARFITGTGLLIDGGVGKGLL